MLTWPQYFMSIAYLASLKSHDAQTKVGSILVEDKKILSTGYNGFPSGTKNDLPNTRPGKYRYICHSEINVLANTIFKPKNASIYVTQMPCNVCAKALWQNNVKEWFVPKNSVLFDGDKEIIKGYTEEDYDVFSLFLGHGLKVHYVDFSPSDLISELGQL